MMLTASIEFDAHTATKDGIYLLLKKVRLLRTMAYYNRRWGDESAIRLASESELTLIQIRATEDDTPGVLELVVEFPEAMAAFLQTEAEQCDAVCGFEIISEFERRQPPCRE